MVVIRGVWKTRRSSDARRVNRLQNKSPEVSGAERQRDDTWIRSLTFLSPGPPTSDGSRGGMENILLECVCVWACKLRAMRAGLSFGALKAQAKPLTPWLLGMSWGMPRGPCLLPSSHGGTGAHWWEPPGCFPQLLALGLPLVPSTHGSPFKNWSYSGETPLRFLGRCIFCSWHMDCLEVCAKRWGGFCFGKPGSSLKNPHSSRAKREKKPKHNNNKTAAMPAGRLHSAINRRCLFYTSLLHRTTKLWSRFLPVQAAPVFATYAEASGLCLHSFVLLWYVKLLSDKIFQAGMLSEEEMKSVRW